jgi:hypothetical protein
MLIDGSINNPSDEDNPLTLFPNKYQIVLHPKEIYRVPLLWMMEDSDVDLLIFTQI